MLQLAYPSNSWLVDVSLSLCRWYVQLAVHIMILWSVGDGVCLVCI